MATTTPFTETAGNDKANLALSLASAILFEGKAAFSVRLVAHPASWAAP